MSTNLTRFNNEWQVRIYPNREFSFCRVRSTDLQGALKLGRSSQQERAISLLHLYGLQTAIHFAIAEREQCHQMSLGEPALDDRPLESTKARNCPKVYGRKGITRHAQRQVRNAAFLLQQRYGKKRLSFITVTLPVLPSDCWYEVCANWSRIRKAFYQGIRYRLQSAGLPTEVVGCVEVQSQRMETEGVPALHIHALFVGRKARKGWAIDPEDLRRLWRNSVENVLKRSLGEVYWGSCENMESPKGDVAKYLAKYMSKGVECLKLWLDQCPEMPVPKQWYTLSRELKKLIESKIKVLRRDAAKFVVYAAIYGDDQWITFVKMKEIKNRMGISYIVAGGGSLTCGALKVVQGLIAKTPLSLLTKSAKF